MAGNLFWRFLQKLPNQDFFRARNAANTADVDLFKLNASDEMEFAVNPLLPGNPASALQCATKQYVDSIIGNNHEIITFSKSSGIAPGAYLHIGQTLSNNAGFILNGSRTITQMSVSIANNMGVGNSATFRLQRRSAVSTFVDIAGTDITIASGQYRTVLTGLSVPIGPDWEISCYRLNAPTGTANNPVLNVFLN
jgi:hypothetical protein